MAIKRNYRLNLRNYGNLPAIMVSQYDEGYSLVFDMYDGALPTGLDGYDVKLKGTRADGLAYEFAGTVSGALNNVLTFPIDTTMTACAGKGTAEVAVIDATNNVLFASFNMPVFVEKAAVPDDAIDADVERAQEIAEQIQGIVDTAASTVRGEAESWAVGQRDGVDVPPTDETYHNNAKYYAAQAQDIAESIGIDATLSVAGKAADAKKVGDELSSVKSDLNNVFYASDSTVTWNYGSLNVNTGKTTGDSVIRNIIRSASFESDASSIYVADDYEAQIFVYDGATYLGILNGSDLNKEANWISDNIVNIRPIIGKSIRILLRRVDQANMDTGEFVNLKIGRYTDSTLTEIDRCADANAVGTRLTALEAETFVDKSLFTNVSLWKRNVLGSGTGAPRYESSTTRLALRPPCRVTPYDILRLTPVSGYKYYVACYNATIDTRIRNIPWSTEQADIDVSDTDYCIILIAKSDDSTITLEDYDKVEIVAVRATSPVDELKNQMGFLPDYWQDYMETKRSTLNAADMALGYGGTSFVFVTDVHVGGNHMQSPKLIKYILDHTAIGLAVCGGDIISAFDTRLNAIDQLATWRDAMKPCKPITIFGNHDANSNAQTDDSAVIAKSAFYAMILKDTEDRVTWEKDSLYGYMDDNVRHIRYIFLDTGAPDGASMSTAQIQWLKDKLLEMTENEYAVVFAHQFWTNAGATSEPTMDSNGTKIINALTDIYQSMTGKVACIVVGHAHRDIDMMTDMGFPVICTTCDTSYGAATYDPDNPTRTEGTTTEQAFDLFYVNTAGKTVDTIRIGAGDTTSNRHFTFI